MKTNEIQNKDEENMTTFRFIEIDAMHESIEIFNIIAGSEEDAFDLANEQEQSNFSNVLRLTNKMLKQLKELKK